MATITITYDSENSFAQKTIEDIISLGIFRVENTDTSKNKASKTEFIENFENALTEAKQIKDKIKQGKIKGLTIEEMLDEI